LALSHRDLEAKRDIDWHNTGVWRTDRQTDRDLAMT